MFLQIIALIIVIFLLVNANLALLSRMLFRLFKSGKKVVVWLSLLFLPGTFLHEIGHLIFAEFLFVRTDDLNIIPELKADGSVKLGGLKIERTDRLRRTIIGLAPILFGLILIWVATFYLKRGGANKYYSLLYVYLLFQITHTMFASKKDLEGAFWGLLGLAILAYIISYLNEVIVFAAFRNMVESISLFWQKNLNFLRDGLLYAVLIDSTFTVFIWFLNKATLWV